MALTSVFYDGPVTESARAANRAGLPEYGVYGAGDFKVTAHPSIPYAVLVKAGLAHGYGVTDTADVDQVVQCESLASGVRWDLIVVRRNWQPELGGPSTLEALQAGAEPVIPATRKTGPGVEDDQPLFLVKWQGGTSAPVDFIDLRVWAGNGGLFAKHDKVREYINDPGTDINVNGIVWKRQLGDNDTLVWARSSPGHWRFERSTATDSNAGDIKGTTGLVSGTIIDAPAGLYWIEGKATLYATSGVVRGYGYAKAGTGLEEARYDFPGDSNPVPVPAQFVHVHTGGNLTIEFGYRQTAGSPIVTGKASGLTRITATLLGN